jgi:hypothetical protein
MKSLLKKLALIACLVQGLPGFAQNYRPMPDSNASWIVNDQSSEYNQNYFFALKSLKDDTLINGQTYINVYCGLPGTDSSKCGGYRYDPVGKSYGISYSHGLHTELLLQDFTAKIGDTVKNVGIGAYDISFDDTVDLLVMDTGHINAGPHRLKWLEMGCPHKGNCGLVIYVPIYWIESVGSSTGGLMNSRPVGFNSYSLVCNSQSDTIFYFDHNKWQPIYSTSNYMYEAGNCIDYLGVEPNRINLGTAVMPNPFTDHFSVSGLQDRLYEVVVYDFTGHICLQNWHIASEGKLIVDTRAFNNGIYFLTLYSNNKLLWTQKIIKQE